MGLFGIGQAVHREEDPRLLTGRGRYVSDFNRTGQLHAYFLRSPHAHADITSIGVSEAQAAEGVVAVFTGADVQAAGLGTPKMLAPLKRPNDEPLFNRAHPGLVEDQVKYVGDPVAMVLGETLDQAKDAAELIEVEYEPLASNTSTARSTDPDCPPVWEENPDNISAVYESGDEAATEAAFQNAAKITKRRFDITRVHAQYMEPRGTLGYYDEQEERYVLHVDVQYPHRVRNVLAEDILKVPEQSVHVIAGDIGGGFGTKGWQYPEHRLTLWAAKKVGRPVKWTCDRSEAILADEHGRDNVTEAELALDRNNKIVGFRIRTLASVGAYVSSVRNYLTAFTSTGLLNGVYKIRAAHLYVKCMQTNTNPIAPYRGAGRPEAIYTIERMMDEAAREYGLDPIELRRTNLIQPEDMPYQTSFNYVYDCGEFEENQNKALEISDYSDFSNRRVASEKTGKLRGFGFANAIEQAAGPGMEFAEIRFNPSGTALVMAGTKNQGQGHETMYKQIVADRLGVDPQDIKFIDGDTDKVGYGIGTMGSRSAVMGGSSMHIAATKVIDKTKIIAAHLLETAEGDVEFVDGNFRVAGTDKSLPFKEVAQAAFKPPQLPKGMEPGLYETGTFRTPNYTFPNGAHTCEIEIDPETGTIELLNYCVVDDVGTVINPTILKGQIHGGIAQGVGQILMEQVVYDPDSGQLLSGSFMDYAMPRADNFGATKIVSNPVPTKNNPLGVKGAGEAGTVGAMPALMNAIMDALSGVGVKHLDMPATPERVWQAIQTANQG